MKSHHYGSSFVVLSLLIACFTFVADAPAQTPARRFEIGGQFSALNISKESSDPLSLAEAGLRIDDTLVGGGVRLGYNLTSHLAIEAAGNLYKRPSADGRHDQGRRSQGLFGIKWGVRRENVGLFAKLRPGFMRFNHIPVLIRNSSINIDDKTIAYFALDAGGVVELYPSRRTLFRFDLGDTIIRYTNRVAKSFEIGGQPNLKTTYGHNLQVEIGFGWRF